LKTAAADVPKAPLYFYGVSKGPAAAEKIAVAGVDGLHRVQPFACAGLLCWVSSVDESFVERISSSMEDLEWLADSGVRHQHAVAAISDKTKMIQARFGTVFLSQESLASHIQKTKDIILRSIRDFEGADEWGVKVYVVPQPVAAAAGVSGKDYLQRKAANLQSRSHAAPDEETREFARALSKISKDTAGTSSIASGQRNLQWQSSFLLPRSRRKQWDALLKRYARRWAGKRQIECSGPWPPYSFVK
jgi:hypothetical protein